MVHKFRIEILQYSQKIALKINISTCLILLNKSRSIELILSFILLVQQASPIAGTHLCLSMPAWVHTCMGIKTVLISTINVINIIGHRVFPQSGSSSIGNTGVIIVMGVLSKFGFYRVCISYHILSWYLVV